MIYPQNFENKLGFDQIRTLIAGYCISSMGKRFVEKIRFSNNRAVIQKMLDQLTEFMHIISFGSAFPTQDYYDLRDELARLKTPGSYIEQEALFDLKNSLRTISEVIHFFAQSDPINYPELKALLQQLFVPDHLLESAEQIIDDKGEIKDKASSRLAEIRAEIAASQRAALRETKKAFQMAKKSGWVPDNSEITIRNGRAVIPLYAADKRAIGGVIHDESASGQTFFVEAAASFEVNNKIRELEGEERREIIKILVAFTDHIRPSINELSNAYRLLGIVDFIRAKALFSLDIKAVKPILSTDSKMLLKDAIHPLLYRAHRDQNKAVIPLNLELSPQERILIISGPNAGGKSVCLKTTGLLQYMLQCGLAVPSSPNSEFRIFSGIFIDIGDEQSLENDLSTYSSHLLNMKYFLRHANENSLVLIDEFGTGTEPLLGGSIAEATLEQLNKKETFGVITTHYTNLKLAAERIKGLINGAMLFDTEAMQPLFQLQIGKPGSSFAFEIAKKIGFPEHVLKNARRKSGGKHVQFDQQLQQLEIDKIKMDKKKHQLDSADESLSQMIDKYSKLLADLEKSKKQIIVEAKEEAYQIIDGSNKAIEKTIRDIKEAKADKVATKALRKELDAKKNSLQTKAGKKAATPQTKEKLLEETPIKYGDFAQVKDSDIVGEVISVDGDEVLLNVNEVKLHIGLSKLVKTKAPKKKTKSLRSNYSNINQDINQKAANFQMSIDLRGKRADEALSLLQKYIDDAILLNMREISILHGKGFGILREIIREFLQSIEEIKQFADAPLDQGGAGITKVFFK